MSNWNLIKSSPFSYLLSAFVVAGESLLWQETNAVQFPELPAKTTCSSCQWYLQKGNSHLYIPLERLNSCLNELVASSISSAGEQCELSKWQNKHISVSLLIWSE